MTLAEFLAELRMPIGPVIGPLVMAGVLIEDSGEHKLRKLGVKDSKQLTPKQRSMLFKKIISSSKAHKIVIVPAEEVDASVLSEEGMNLNWLEAHKSIEIINALKPDKVILDSPSNNVRAYKDFVMSFLKKDIEVVAEHKADVNYPVVSAASILAKVTRDREIEKIQATIPEPIGSGYAHDPVTIKFIRSNFEKYPHIFRKSWETYQQLVEEKRQRKLGQF